MEKGTSAMLTLLETAKKAAIPAKYVLFDSWFSSPSTLHAVKKVEFDIIGMVKKTPKMFFRYNGEDMSLVSIYDRNKKRRGKSRLSYDAMTAHTAVVFTRYMMLPPESRESNDDRSFGELFLYFSDEMSDITWIQAFQMLLQMFRTMLTENTELSDDKIDELVDTFMNALPVLLKTQLQAA